MGAHFFVGALSDLWLAFLWSIVALLVQGLVLLFIRGSRWGFIFSYLVLVITTVFHQNYVSFFHFQVVPYHISYMGDSHFVGSSLISLFHTGPMLLLTIGLLFGWLALRVSRGKFGLQYSGWSFAFFFFLCLFAHNRNIHLRVQWFVPSELQVQFWERLYFHARDNPLPEPLGQSELQNIADHLDISAESDDFLRGVIYPKVADSTPSPEATALKKAFKAVKAEGRMPMVITILMESLRPSEVGAYYPGRPTITPHMDRLAAEGLLFSQAYATGTVTRGGQEAAFCGYLGSRNTSMMRNRPDVKLACLPEILPVTSFWFHGGEGAFDSQETFWQQRNIPHLMTIDDFSEDTPSTPWGKSDVALFQASFKRLGALRQENPQSPFLGMILSLSNHNPWSLPDDAPPTLKQQAASLDSGQFATTLYADHALGNFLSDLKASSHWQDTLIVVASDHGVAGQPFHPLPKSETNLAHQKSHMALILGGGIIKAAGLEGKVWQPHVSQADIAPLIAFLFDQSDKHFMGEMLLTNARQRPVLCDLGEKVFSPKLGKSFSKKDQAKGPQSEHSGQEAFALSYYRAFLHFLNKGQDQINTVNKKQI